MHQIEIQVVLLNMKGKGVTRRLEDLGTFKVWVSDFQTCVCVPDIFPRFIFYFYLLFKRLYLFVRDTERESTRQRHRQREKKVPCGKPNAGLNPRTKGPRPEPKGDAQPLNHPGALGKENSDSGFC